ncbi:hypothetical protein Angca_000914 [Angiostrongylus cantonensis]|nr:hypothetical protein Angca_000914 [Angiostrongylus cantonensis]
MRRGVLPDRSSCFHDRRRSVDMPQDVLRPVQMKYSSSSPKAKTPSFIEKVQSLIAPVTETTMTTQPVKVRLINGWQDVTFEKMNIVICNYLYDHQSANHQMWKELEKITTLRREYLFYGMCCAVSALFFRNDLLTLLYCVVALVLPAICTIVALSTENLEGARFWLEYWAIYGLITSVGKTLKSHGTNDTSWIEVVFFAACLLPGTCLINVVFSCIMPTFNNLRLKFEEYNYYFVS